MSETGKINHDQTGVAVGRLWFTVIFTSFFIVVVFVVGFFFFKSTISMELNLKDDTDTSLEIKRLRQYEQDSLHQLKWKSKSKGTVQIPIDLAIDNVVEDYKNLSK